MARKKQPAIVPQARNVTIRIAHADLDLARKQAAERGLPYQTYIKSILHKALVKRDRRKGKE